MARRTTRAFTDIISEIPFSPTTENGSGFLPPLLRALVHVGHVISSEEATQADILAEIEHAEIHLRNVVVDSRFSTDFKNQLNNLTEAISASKTEFVTWEDDKRRENMRNLLNRLIGLSVILDREALGIRNSDAGFSL